MTKIVIADDHQLFREGLGMLLRARLGEVELHEAADGPAAVLLALAKQPDFLLLDLAMPGGNGLDAIPRILAASSGTSILVLSTHRDRGFVSQALAAGARGYILKDSAFDEVERALSKVAQGHRYLSAEVSDGILSSWLSGEGPASASGPFSLLTERELCVLRMICEEKTAKAIALELGISRKTVDVHKRNIMAKCGVANDVGLVKLAMKEGILPRE